ncbi:MAG: pyridoxamine 5'-phosphate oxidase [Gammaproteobacteria bacterium]|nr:pyridoxamine 5'-phosphate oxidase [Gammaproteobacteria bacterium]
MIMKAEVLRTELMLKGMAKSDLLADPMAQFESWYQQALTTDMAEPTAMSLATVDANGQPWQRMVLLKMFDENGFVFFTNYSSRKAQQIAGNAKVSLLFPWQALGRQVKITGTAEKIATADSLKYFASRPRGSQIGAWASHQSQVITTRAMLDTLFEQMKDKFSKGEVPLPSFWGGYRVKPSSFEFWQARDSRLHDQFVCEQGDDESWQYQRLAP